MSSQQTNLIGLKPRRDTTEWKKWAPLIGALLIGGGGGSVISLPFADKEEVRKIQTDLTALQSTVAKLDEQQKDMGATVTRLEEQQKSMPGAVADEIDRRQQHRRRR